ncbi:MAG: hypothetical protein NPMRD1_160019 [Nitrosopumilales archaeon]|jgi:hypothetical protein|nr:MAG: hypothetical protein NPMRD1_160019 [Nitrosopumilales archaeon]
MKQEVILSQRQDSPPEDGMLFVRTTGILTTMVRAPLILVGLMLVAITIPAQISFGLVRSLDLTIYPDGTTHVYSEISVDPLEPDFEVNLFGPTVNNFVAEDENGFFLSGQIEGNKAIVETLGSSKLSIDYDVHDLVSKEGRIWSFNLDSPTDFTLLMPKNIVIVGMSNIPLNMEIENEQSKLSLSSGPIEINYFFGVSNPILTPTPDPESDNSLFLIIGAVVIAGVIAAVFMKRVKLSPQKKISDTAQLEKIEEKPLDVETIFSSKPDLREDDKELINFLYANGGKAYESELRKKFLQPRTTMWRAVKRLERYGIVEIKKKELQNLVILKKNLEDEQ